MEAPVYYTHSIPANDPCEDGHVIATLGKKHLFAVIDGHGGTGVKDLIFERLATAWAETPFHGTMALDDVILKMEKAAMNENCGACLAMAVYDPDAEQSLTVASVGDCAVIAAYLDEDEALHPFRASGAEHNYKNAHVLLDAIQKGGSAKSFTIHHQKDDVTISRTSPDGKSSIQLSRAIGDAKFKKYTSASPNVFTDAVGDIPFIVLCSNGVTDNLSDGEIVSMVAGFAYDDAEQCAAEIVAAAESRAAFKRMMPPSELRAMKAGSGRRDLVDDMTAVVVFFHG